MNAVREVLATMVPIIEEYNDELRRAHTVDGTWDGSEPDAQAEYERVAKLIAAARAALALPAEPVAWMCRAQAASGLVGSTYFGATKDEVTQRATYSLGFDCKMDLTPLYADPPDPQDRDAPPHEETMDEQIVLAAWELVRAAGRMRDKWSDGDNNVKDGLWRNLHEKADALRGLLEPTPVAEPPVPPPREWPISNPPRRLAVHMENVMTTRVTILNHGPDEISVRHDSGNTGSELRRIKSAEFCEPLYIFQSGGVVSLHEIKAEPVTSDALNAARYMALRDPPGVAHERLCVFSQEAAHFGDELDRRVDMEIELRAEMASEARATSSFVSGVDVSNPPDLIDRMESVIADVSGKRTYWGWLMRKAIDELRRHVDNSKPGQDAPLWTGAGHDALTQEAAQSRMNDGTVGAGEAAVRQWQDEQAAQGKTSAHD